MRFFRAGLVPACRVATCLAGPAVRSLARWMLAVFATVISVPRWKVSNAPLILAVPTNAYRARRTSKRAFVDLLVFPCIHAVLHVTVRLLLAVILILARLLVT